MSETSEQTTNTKTKIIATCAFIAGIIAVIGLVAFANYLPTMQKYQRDEARTEDLYPLRQYALEYREQFGEFPAPELDAWQQLLTDNNIEALADGATDAKYYLAGICTYGDETCMNMEGIAWGTHPRAIYVTYKSACTEGDHNKDYVSPIVEAADKDDITIVTVRESGGQQCLDI